MKYSICCVMCPGTILNMLLLVNSYDASCGTLTLGVSLIRETSRRHRAHFL